MKKLQDDVSSSYITTENDTNTNIENNIASTSKGTSIPQYKVVYQIIRDFEELCYSSKKSPKIVKHISNCNPQIMKDQFCSNQMNNPSITTNENGIAKDSGPSRESNSEEVLLLKNKETEANKTNGAKFSATTLEQIYRETKDIHSQFSKLYKYSRTAVLEDEIESIYEKQSEYFEKISKFKMFLSFESIDNNIVNTRSVNFNNNEASVKVNSICCYKSKTQENIISSSISSDDQLTVHRTNNNINTITQGLKITSPVVQFGTFLVDNGNKELNQWEEKRESASTSNKCDDMLLFPSEIKYNKINTKIIKTYINRRKNKMLANVSLPKTPLIDKYKKVIKHSVSVPKKIEYKNPTSPWNNINFEKYNLIATSNQKSHTVIAMPHFKKKIILNLPFKKRTGKEEPVIKKPKYYTFERYDYLSTRKSKLPAKNSVLSISRKTVNLNSGKEKKTKRSIVTKAKRRTQQKSKNITKANHNSIENYITKDKKLLSAVVRIPKLMIKKKKPILGEIQKNTGSKDNEEIQVISDTSDINNKIMTPTGLLPTLLATKVFNCEMKRFISGRNILINPIATRTITQPLVNTFKISSSMLFNYFLNQTATTSTERFIQNDVPVEFTETVANVIHSLIINKFRNRYPNKLKLLNSVALLNLRKLDIYNHHITSRINEVIQGIDKEMANATTIAESLKNTSGSFDKKNKPKENMQHSEESLVANEDVATLPKKFKKGMRSSMSNQNEDNTQKRKLQRTASKEKKLQFSKLIKKQKIETRRT